jgi:tryptophanyl-tRNA synthetase
MQMNLTNAVSCSGNKSEIGKETAATCLQAAYAVEIFTGMRPTGNLTVANYVGAVKPLLQLASSGARPTIFVADMHALTTHEPADVAKLNLSVVADYIALGLDPQKVDIFLQSSIQQETLEATFMLMRHVSVAELLRVPTLKDKIRNGQSEATASALLACYPVMMAADILLQRARYVPVGIDQLPHIEVTRLLADRFNRQYGSVFPLPDSQIVEPIKILGLKGTGKMGKSIPDEAVFLADPEGVIRKKIKSAMTACPGEMTEALKSNIALAQGLCYDSERLDAVDSLIAQHMAGEKVMGSFKALLAEIVVDFVRGFQERRALLEKQPDYLNGVLEAGNQRARQIACETLRLAREAQSRAISQN